MHHEDISPVELGLKIEQLRKPNCIYKIDRGIQLLQKDLMRLEKEEEMISLR
jgi:hypothetical protein